MKKVLMLVLCFMLYGCGGFIHPETVMGSPAWCENHPNPAYAWKYSEPYYYNGQFGVPTMYVTPSTSITVYHYGNRCSHGEHYYHSK